MNIKLNIKLDLLEKRIVKLSSLANILSSAVNNDCEADIAGVSAITDIIAKEAKKAFETFQDIELTIRSRSK